MSSHQVYYLSKTSEPIQITPTVEHNGMNVYIQNISDHGYVYIGTNHQYSKLALDNFGHRLGPNESIKITTATLIDHLYLITPNYNIKVAVLRQNVPAKY
jgi:hypothetical protein